MLRSSSPHIRASSSSEKIMRRVLIALSPAVAAGLYFFRGPALALLVLTLLSTFIFDILFQKMSGARLKYWNGSSYVTSILLYLTLPPTVPWWIPVIGVAVALGIGKYLFGKGNSIFNPALVGRAFLVVSWPAQMTTWVWPDGITRATPLAAAKSGLFYSKMVLLTGNVAGCIGETSAIALLIGGLYLIYKRMIDWKIPAIYIGGVFVLSAFQSDPIYQILGGGLLLGAFFMATDYGTIPLTSRGRVIFAIGLVLLTFIFRFYSSMAEGVMYSILLMNAAAPIIERFTIPKPFGYRK